MNRIKAYLEKIKKYAEQDYESFCRIKDAQAVGLCSIPLLQFAFSIVDMVAMFEYSTKDNRKNGTGVKFKDLLNHPAFSHNTVGDGRDVNYIYEKLRCGTVHEFYLREGAIERSFPGDTIVIKDRVVSPDAMFDWAIKILEKQIERINNGTYDTANQGRMIELYEALFEGYSATIPPNRTSVSGTTAITCSTPASKTDPYLNGFPGSSEDEA